MLLDLAARKWSVERSALAIADGKVSSGERSVGFGELARGEKWTRTIPARRRPTKQAGVPLAAPAEWKTAGKSLPKVNGRDIVTGAHKYSYDLKRPGMLHAKVLYPPQFGATLISLDASAAEAMPGVKVVHEGNFVAVAAPEADMAAKAVSALKAQWKPVTAEADSHTRTGSGYGRQGGQRVEGPVEAGDGGSRQPHRIPVFRADRAGRRGGKH